MDTNEKLKSAVYALLKDNSDKQNAIDNFVQKVEAYDQSVQNYTSQLEAEKAAAESKEHSITVVAPSVAPVIPAYQPPITTSGYITHPDGSMTSVNLISTP